MIKQLFQNHLKRYWFTRYVTYNTYMLFAGREVRIGKNCVRGLECRPRPQAEGRAQDRGYSFPQFPRSSGTSGLGWEGDDLLAGKKVTKSPNACVEIGKETQ